MRQIQESFERGCRLDVTRAAGGGAHRTFVNFIVSIITCNLHHICHWF